VDAEANLLVLGGTRLLEGASGAASVPSILGYVAIATAGDEMLRGRAVARFEAATLAGLGGGIVAAGVLWHFLGPVAFFLNAGLYLCSWAIYRFGVTDPRSEHHKGEAPAYGVGHYMSLLRSSHVWLLAPTWIAVNASPNVYLFGNTDAAGKVVFTTVPNTATKYTLVVTDAVGATFTDAHVILAVEKKRQTGELIVHWRDHTLTAKDTNADMYMALSRAISKIEKQAIKLKKKIINRKHGSPKTSVAVAKTDRQLKASPPPVRIVNARRYNVKPMTAEEAALELSDRTDQFVVFRDADTDRVGVLYKRQDGNFGLIEP
jgi:putative sigma-54 modulation protein